MLSMSNMGDQVWFITSRQTDPDLRRDFVSEDSRKRHGGVER